MRSSALRVVKPPEEISQAEKEAAAWANHQAAIDRGDREDASLWFREYARLHAERPVAMVERLERERGLR